jgi:hypothetical protein
MGRQRRKARHASETSRGLLLGAVGLVILLALVGAYWWVKSSRPQLDAESNCPKSGPSGIHVLLFDQSDPISDQQAQRIRQTIETYKADAPFGMRFDLYTFDGDTTHVLKPRLSICALGKPQDANQFIENPERVRLKYETRFSSVLKQTVDDLLRGNTQPSSPIIESIRAAAISSFGPVEAGHIPLRMTLISDMVQHTKLASQFQAELKFQELSRSPVWVALQPQLKGANVEILYLLRPNAMRNRVQIQSGPHQRFWEQLINGSGGQMSLIEPI